MDLTTNTSFCNLMQSQDSWIQPYPTAITVCVDIANQCSTSPNNVTKVGTIAPQNNSNPTSNPISMDPNEEINVYGFYSPSYSAAFDCASKLAPNVSLVFTNESDYERVHSSQNGMGMGMGGDSDSSMILLNGNWKIGTGLIGLFGIGIFLQIL